MSSAQHAKNVCVCARGFGISISGFLFSFQKKLKEEKHVGSVGDSVLTYGPYFLFNEFAIITAQSVKRFLALPHVGTDERAEGLSEK